MCAPLLVSGYRNVALSGVVDLVAVIVSARLIVSGFAPVWCVSAGACRHARQAIAPRGMGAR